MNKVFVAMSNQVEQNIMDKLKGLPLIPTPYSPVLADEDTEVIKIKGFDNDTAMNLWDEFANESDGWTTTMGYDDFEKAIKKANEIYNENN
jgi:hypothetical protein